MAGLSLKFAGVLLDSWRGAFPFSVPMVSFAVGKAEAAGSLFESLHEGEEIVDLVWIELKGGHGGVTGIDALRKGLCQRLDLVASMEIAEWRSNLQRTWAEPIDGVTARAVRLRENEPPLLAG